MTATPATAATTTQQGETLLRIEDLKTYYPIYAGILRRVAGYVRAVDGVSFDIKRGEVFGLVGESGCGKTTLGRTLLRLETPTSGAATLGDVDIFKQKGGDLKALRRRMQVIFQDPVASLNPRMPISDIIGEGMLAQADDQNGWGKRAIRDKRTGDYLEEVGLRRDYARRYPHEFSGGQRQRIGIARALALSPEFIFADEPVSALDVSIQSQILNLILDLRERFGLTFLFVAHNLSVVQYISDRVGVMYLGMMAEVADVETLYAQPRHPYTVALLSAVPDPDPRVRKRLIVLKGDVPSPVNPPSGCRFHTRCWLRERLGNPERCTTEIPEFREIDPGHQVACHFAEDVPERLVAEAVAAPDAVVVDTSAEALTELDEEAAAAIAEAEAAAAAEAEAAAASASDETPTTDETTRVDATAGTDEGASTDEDLADATPASASDDRPA